MSLDRSITTPDLDVPADARPRDEEPAVASERVLLAASVTVRSSALRENWGARRGAGGRARGTQAAAVAR
jgi:hypothetical protein